MAEPFAKPYVDALLEVAGSPAAAEALLPGLDALAALLRESDELRAVLGDPGVGRERKNAVLSALAGRLALPELGTRLAETLLSNRRLPHLHDVLAALRERLDRERGVVAATVVTPAPLADGAREALRGALEARTRRQVRLAAEVDPGLLGGFVVRIGSEVFDASLAHRLEKARAAVHAVSGTVS